MTIFTKHKKSIVQCRLLFFHKKPTLLILCVFIALSWRFLSTSFTNNNTTTSLQYHHPHDPPPRLHNHSQSLPIHRTFTPGDYAGGKDRPPIVLEQYKLIFFPTAKVATTTFHFLFRRVMGYQDWYTVSKKLPHTMGSNGLVYLTDFSKQRAHEIMTDPTWTKAIFVRDPKERLLSAYLNKGVHKFEHYLWKICKRKHISKQECQDQHASSLESFFQFVTANHPELAMDEHWIPQYERMQPEYWPFMNFIGNFERIQHDAKRLLQRLGMWELYGQYGWGNEIRDVIQITNKNESIFASTSHHSTNAKTKLMEHYNNTEFEQRVQDFYKMDYNNKFYSHFFKKG